MSINIIQMHQSEILNVNDMKLTADRRLERQFATVSRQATQATIHAANIRSKSIERTSSRIQSVGSDASSGSLGRSLTLSIIGSGGSDFDQSSMTQLIKCESPTQPVSKSDKSESEKQNIKPDQTDRLRWAVLAATSNNKKATNQNEALHPGKGAAPRMSQSQINAQCRRIGSIWRLGTKKTEKK